MVNSLCNCLVTQFHEEYPQSPNTSF
jgi:hypothetical protein